MRTNRRGFLGMMAAAPVAARQSAEKALAGIRTENGLSEKSVNTWTTVGLEDHTSEWEKMVDWFGRHGIPDWKRHEMMSDARREARTLDPDVAALHSMSVSARYNSQVRRNYQRMVRDQKSSICRDKEEKEFNKRFYDQ